MDIEELIGEGTEYDKKEFLEDRKPKSWLKSVSAFANGVGGALIFGFLMMMFLSDLKIYKRCLKNQRDH